MASSRITSNGPDWLDCRVLMREMQTSLDARVELTIVPSKGEDTAGVVLKATAHPYLSVGADQRRSVSLSAVLTTSSAGMGTAAIFRLLLALDYEVSKAWAVKQAT